MNWMMLKRVSIISAALLALSAASYATPERVIFNSSIYSVSDTFGFVAAHPNAAVGHTLSFSYIIDPSAPNLHLPPDDKFDPYPANGTYDARFEALYLDGVAISTPLAPQDMILKVQYYPSQFLADINLPVSATVGTGDSAVGYLGGVYIHNEDLPTGSNFPDIASAFATNRATDTFYHFYTVGHDTQIRGHINAITFEAVPEPASMAALGLGAVALLRRRRRA